MGEHQTSAGWTIVASRFNEAVVDRLVEGALGCLDGGHRRLRSRTPGCYIRQKCIVHAQNPPVAIHIELQLAVVDRQAQVGLPQVEVSRSGDLAENAVGDLVTAEIVIRQP